MIASNQMGERGVKPRLRNRCSAAKWRLFLSLRTLNQIALLGFILGFLLLSFLFPERVLVVGGLEKFIVERVKAMVGGEVKVELGRMAEAKEFFINKVPGVIRGERGGELVADGEGVYLVLWVPLRLGDAEKRGVLGVLMGERQGEMGRHLGAPYRKGLGIQSGSVAVGGSEPQFFVAVVRLTGGRE